MFIIFFFQAEDGIRDGRVTGVQTCALPISGYISADTPRTEVDKRYVHPDVLVAGGGPAGMAAAVAAAQAGARVMLVEEEHRLGGHLRWGDAADLAALAELRDLVAATPGIEVLTNAVVSGRYDGNWV